MPLVMFVVIAIIQLLLAFLHWVIYQTIVQVFNLNVYNVLVILRVLVIFLAVSFVAASLLVFKYQNIIVKIFYTGASVWLVFLTYFMAAGILYWSFYIITINLSYNFNFNLVGIALFLLAILVSSYGLIHARQLAVTAYNLNLSNLPQSWLNRKIVFLSDLHLGAINGLKYAQRVVELVARQNPDIIFIGGDVYDGTPLPLAESKNFLRQLQAPLGTYFITGNHEEFGDPTPYIETIKEAGIKVLNNEKVVIEGLQILGVDYQNSRAKDKFKSILISLGIDKNSFSILLRHEPSHLDIAQAAGVSLQISGHTHRAQLFPLNLVTSLVYKGFDYGFKYKNDMAVITSSGVGTWGPPSRVGSPSEIVVISFKNSDNGRL